ncbi:hypothetical protein A9Q99_11325 [Gammaproteobacteria bacterium 45_16_T64]|nr:hypothetical protein A9Q99_11325 [Gammaproteobacteria bacterium 45_16_T64]
MIDSGFVINNAMTQGLDVIGDRWALLILRDAFLGRSRFEEFRQHTGASRATLTRRLESLIAADVLYKRSYSSSGKRFEYKLTEKGMGLFSSSLLSWQWERDWTDVSPDVLPPALFHTSCGHSLTPCAVCRHCNQALEIDDIEWPALNTGLDKQLSDIQLFNKRRVRSSAVSGQQDRSLTYVSDLVGDRWTLLLLITAFLGISRYDTFIKQLGISTNILSDRLNLLVEVDIFERNNYQENPPRSEYKLTTKGKSLYPLVMAMRQWVIDWLPTPDPSEKLIHKNCGKALAVDVVCDSCGQKPWVKDVNFVVQ